MGNGENFHRHLYSKQNRPVHANFLINPENTSMTKLSPLTLGKLGVWEGETGFFTAHGYSGHAVPSSHTLVLEMWS